MVYTLANIFFYTNISLSLSLNVEWNSLKKISSRDFFFFKFLFLSRVIIDE